MIRSFAAISIPEFILERIETVIVDLKELKIEARYTKTPSMHLTLKFLGNIEESLVESVSKALEQSARTVSRFSLDIERIGFFPNSKRPRIVWIGVEEDPMLSELQRQVEKNLQRLGFEAETRPFKPHLTLARLKSSRNLPELQRFLEMKETGFRIGSFDVDSIHLYQSILRPDGAEYRRLCTHGLGTGS